MENLTNLTNTTGVLSSEGVFDCEDITNNGLYKYLLDMCMHYAHNIRNYMKVILLC